jgi:photosystem II stability/assembly factor-like uncharacterized protein
MSAALAFSSAVARGAELKAAIPLTRMHPMPEDYMVTGVSCSGPGIVLFGHHRPFATGDRETRILRWQAGETGWKTTYSEPDSRVGDYSIGVDGTLFVLVVGKSAPRLIRSSDDGTSWTPLANTPAGTFGAEFRDARFGFAWGSKRVAATADGGQTWKSSSARGVVEEGSPWPVVDAAENLWVAKMPMTGPHGILVRIGPDPATRSEMPSKDSIVGMATSGSDLWLALRDGGYGTAVVAKLAEDGRKFDRVAELNADLPIDFAVRGRDMAVLLAHVEGMTSTRYVAFSEDGGESWTRMLPGRDSAQRICIGARNELWVAGRESLWSSSGPP